VVANALPTDNRRPTTDDRRRSKSLRLFLNPTSLVLFAILFGILLGLGGIAAAASVTPGGLKGLRAWWHGVPVILVPDRIQLGSVEEGKRHYLSFTAVNFLDRQVQLSGASSNCDCVSGIEFPIELAPYERREIPL
jgi:hypothetical protein